MEKMQQLRCFVALITKPRQHNQLLLKIFLIRIQNKWNFGHKSYHLILFTTAASFKAGKTIRLLISKGSVRSTGTSIK
jgi:hypothetical protein